MKGCLSFYINMPVKVKTGTRSVIMRNNFINLTSDNPESELLTRIVMPVRRNEVFI